jgi:hypothetical protein
MQAEVDRVVDEARRELSTEQQARIVAAEVEEAN